MKYDKIKIAQEIARAVGEFLKPIHLEITTTN